MQNALKKTKNKNIPQVILNTLPALIPKVMDGITRLDAQRSIQVTAKTYLGKKSERLV